MEKSALRARVSGDGRKATDKLVLRRVPECNFPVCYVHFVISILIYIAFLSLHPFLCISFMQPGDRLDVDAC